MRISQEALVTSTLTRLRSRLQHMERSQAELATGRRVQRPSDDPGGMASILSLRATSRARQQEERNAADGATWVRMTDTKLQAALDTMQRVRELAVRAASSTGAAEREGIAAEMTGLRDGLVAIANATHQGQGLFSGTAAGAAVAQVAGAWTYTGDQTAITRRVGDEDVVQVSLTAESVFGFAAGQDVFTALDQLAASARAGDAQGVSAQIAGVDAALGRVLDGLAQIGAAGNRVEHATTRNQSEQLALRAQMSEIEDVDLSEAVMELQLQEMSYQATLKTMAHVLQPSLADFLA